MYWTMLFRRWNTCATSAWNERGGSPMPVKLDLNAFLLFYELVNAQSINRAAKKLRMPKSTVSRKLSSLERQVGALLVKRGTRSLTTTDIGRAFYEHCGRIAEQADAAASEKFEKGRQPAETAGA